MKILELVLQRIVIWKCYNGSGVRAVGAGIAGLVHLPHREVISYFSPFQLDLTWQKFFFALKNYFKYYITYHICFSKFDFQREIPRDLIITTKLIIVNVLKCYIINRIILEKQIFLYSGVM